MRRSIKEVIQNNYNNNSTLLGVGPMSTSVIEACFRSAKKYSFPLIFIASRNQIDLKKFGGGYVNGWDQFDFAEAILEKAKKYDFYDYYLCRDHGGPWQRDEERSEHLDLEKAMQIAKESFAADIEAGFDLIMVDPTKDPFTIGKVVDLDFVIDKTVELIEFCENKRRENNIHEISYEIGTEETNGGLTNIDTYREFIERVKERLLQKKLPMPIFIVGQTGTLVKSTKQAGSFNYREAKRLSDVAAEYGVFLKEHNADYLDSTSLLMHIPARVAASNVAPQFGVMETQAYLILCDLEEKLFKNGDFKKSNLYNELLKSSIKTGRWKKWVSGEQIELSLDEILNNKKFSREILNIAGHYTLNEPVIKKEIHKLYDNLKEYHIDGNEFVINHIETAIFEYVKGFNMINIL